MERTNPSIQVIAIALCAAMAPAVSSAEHWAHQEAPLQLLFKDAPPRAIRGLSSQGTPKLPVLTFHRAVSLNSSGESKIGKSCFVRDTSLAQHSGRDYFNSAMAQTPGGKIKAGETFDMGLISAQFESIRIELISKIKPFRRLEIGCTQANIQDWTISDFETSTAHAVSVKIPSSIPGVRFAQSNRGVSSARIKDLKGFRYNGVFGSGLPGTSGVQLLFGANLKAYSDETGASLMQGRRCRVKAQAARSFNDRYFKGSKFSFLGYLPKPEMGTVEMVFGNWNHSPHQIHIECLGSESSVRELALKDIESDLNGAIQFYRK
jgi:hypothetical protein